MHVGDAEHAPVVGVKLFGRDCDGERPASTLSDPWIDHAGTVHR